jgi:hypothetical protein
VVIRGELSKKRETTTTTTATTRYEYKSTTLEMTSTAAMHQ